MTSLRLLRCLRMKSTERSRTLKNSLKRISSEGKVELQNQADTLIYSTENTLKDLAKSQRDQNKKVEKAVENLKDALKNRDVSRINPPLKNLTKEDACNKHYSYQQQAQQQQPVQDNRKLPKKKIRMRKLLMRNIR